MAKDKPYYFGPALGSIPALAKCLGVNEAVLLDLSVNSNQSYTEISLITNKGKERVVYDPKYELKRIQKRINSRIFEKIYYPGYLQGGIKDANSPRDYYQNSKLHAGSSWLIGLDIRSFYNNIRENVVLDLYRFLLKFPTDVAELLTRLTTLNGHVPQGACTSSYIANLIFFNSEYKLVSSLRGQGVVYTRLLDDVTLSSKISIGHDKKSEYIKQVAALFRKSGLRINSKKTKIENSADKDADYKVTGVWVGHGLPKLRKADRRYIRQMVWICEREHEKSSTSQAYHDLWNKTSGYVAKLSRFEHSQSKSYRFRLSLILPQYDAQRKFSLILESKKLLLKKNPGSAKLGLMCAYNKAIYRLGILGRTDKKLASQYKSALKFHFKDAPKIKDFWS